MSQAQHKDGYGAFFQNNKQGQEGRPDYTGEVMLEGKLYRLAGWKRVSKKGNAFLSLSIEEKREAATQSFSNSNGGW
jgi:uncharacterized protein (DUF736 family)